jgi:hypothetical protein
MRANTAYSGKVFRWVGCVDECCKHMHAYACLHACINARAHTLSLSHIERQKKTVVENKLEVLTVGPS